jgi:hypothetical protein
MAAFVMLWTAAPTQRTRQVRVLTGAGAALGAPRRSYITFHGERLRGSWALVRTDRARNRVLLIGTATHARRGSDLAAEYSTSVATGGR